MKPHGVIANTRTETPRVHYLTGGLPLCGATAFAVNDKKRISLTTAIQFDIGEVNCKRCLKLLDFLEAERKESAG